LSENETTYEVVVSSVQVAEIRHLLT